MRQQHPGTAADDRNKPQSFKPTRLQLRYRDVRARAVVTGRAPTDTALARELPCRNATISGWRRNPEFLAWLDAEARAAVEHLWRPILPRAAQLALQGSVEHMEFLAPFMTGASGHRSAPGLGSVQVVIGVPRPTRE
jgi:hypothetical protein